MGKQPKYETGSDRYDNPGGRIKAIKKLDDIEPDSEDEFHARREKILLDTYDERNYDETESSEEEVFALKTGDTSEDDKDDEFSEESEVSQDEDAVNFDATWGGHKKYYYDADEISDLEEAKEEEEEALRLQKKRISQMAEDDFLEHEELVESKMDDKKLKKQNDKQNLFANSSEIQTEVLNKDRLASLPHEEILRIIQSESPELIELLSEFNKKSLLLQETISLLEKARQKNKINSPAVKFLSIKHQTLVHYLTNISFFLVLKSSGTKNLREHPVIDALVELKVALDKLKELEFKVGDLIKEFIDNLDQPDEVLTESKNENGDEGERAVDSKKKKSKHIKKKRVRVDVKINGKMPRLSPDDVNRDNKTPQILPTPIVEEEFVSFKKSKNKRKLDSTDFGDLDALDEIDAEEKARKKSLRHYVAKIDQKLAKHDRAIRQSGDADLPYKDRDNIRNNKIIRSQKESDANLDDQDWDDDDMQAAIDMDNEDDFYQAVKNAKKVVKEQKMIRSEETNVIYEEDETLPDGAKRQINYQILKNKGLTPRRKKEQRNPRVKHRNKYEKAKKKIKSIRPEVTKQLGSYGGEKT
ncbi:12412_t:CDS:10, partial [Acaulospora morrowiae]